MPKLLDFSGWPILANIAIFAASAVVIWLVGTRMVRLVDRLASRTGMGQGFAGMLILGGIVSLTEISTVSTAAFTGSPLLALNNLLGSESINLFLLAAVDPLTGREALTSFIAKPAMLLQCALGIVLLAVVAIAMATGDFAVFDIGLWSTALFILGIGALRLSAGYEKRKTWIAFGEEQKTDQPQAAAPEDKPPEKLAPLIGGLAALSAVIFVAGFFLSLAGDALAVQSGLGTSFVGFLLVGMSTSLPELSTIIAAIRLKRHEMAVGDLLGSNIFNLLLIFLTDVVYVGGPVLNHVGRFEQVAALIGLVMTGILLIGMLERWNKTIFRMGYDSAAMLVVFLGGVVILYALSGLAS